MKTKYGINENCRNNIHDKPYAHIVPWSLQNITMVKDLYHRKDCGLYGPSPLLHCPGWRQWGSGTEQVQKPQIQIICGYANVTIMGAGAHQGIQHSTIPWPPVTLKTELRRSQRNQTASQYRTRIPAQFLDLQYSMFSWQCFLNLTIQPNIPK